MSFVQTFAASALLAVSVGSALASDLQLGSLEVEVRETPRVALVIGNADFVDSRIEPAVNARTDAREMAKKLAALRFDTVVHENASYDTMYRELVSLRDRRTRIHVNRGDRPVVLVYYSGHGYSRNGRAFIAGSDVDVGNPDDRSLRIETLLSEISRSSYLIVLLDACRTEAKRPATTLPAIVPASSPTWSGGGVATEYGGIGSVPRSQVTGGRKVDAKLGHTFIVGYAVLRLGDAALNAVEDTDTVSPYTRGLLRHIGKDGETIDLELDHVRVAVRQHTEQVRSIPQEPDKRGSVGPIRMRELPETTLDARDALLKLTPSPSSDDLIGFILKYPASPYAYTAMRWLDLIGTNNE